MTMFGEGKIAMEILTEPVSEEQVLAVTCTDAETESIVVDIEARGLTCVDHLCGCK